MSIKKSYEVKVINGSIYDQWLHSNRKNFNVSGIEYFEKKVTFEDINKMIDVYARAFKSLRNNENSSVTICGPLIPSTIYSFYALNKLGVRVNFVSPNLIAVNGKKYIDDNETETLIILDRFYPSVVTELKKTSLKNVILTSLSDDVDLNLKEKLGGTQIYDSIKTEQLDNKLSEFLNLEKLLKVGENKNDEIVSKYERDSSAVILYTGGSTGVPKGVEITNEGMTNMYKICLEQEYDYEVGDRNLCLIPPNHPTSFVHCLVTPWLYGTTQVLQPIYDKKTFANDLKNLKVQYAMGAASHYATLLKSNLKENDLAHLKWAFCGCEPVSYELARNINKVFERTGVQNPYLALGYGMSELGPMCMLSYKIPGLYNKVGRPVPTAKARIRDIKTGKFLGSNKRGKLEIKTPCRMKGYYKNPELTKQFFMDDGYARTGDIAVRDEFGNYEVLGRENDSFEAPNGEIIYLFDIENFIYQDDAIMEAEVVKIPVNDGINKWLPLVHVVLKPEYIGQEKAIIQRLHKKCLNKFKGFYIPKGYKVRKEFETNLASGKRDYLSLLDEREGFYIPDRKGNLIKLKFPEKGCAIVINNEKHDLKGKQLIKRKNNF